MQSAWSRLQDRTGAEAAPPGGLAGWVLGLIRGRGATRTARHLHVVEQLSLGGRRQLTLVVCDGERFLVGGGADGVETIVRVGLELPAETPCL